MNLKTARAKRIAALAKLDALYVMDSSGAIDYELTEWSDKKAQEHTALVAEIAACEQVIDRCESHAAAHQRGEAYSAPKQKAPRRSAPWTNWSRAWCP